MSGGGEGNPSGAGLSRSTLTCAALDIHSHCDQYGTVSNLRRPGTSIDGSNVPGNPLRSYRMSMLAHGFVDHHHDDEFKLDESDPMSYSVVRLRAQPLTALSIAVVLAVLVATVATYLLA